MNDDMMTGDDMTLVREFATRHSEPAFATLVERHIGLVHAAAQRQAGDAHLAQEITQAVFIVLARKAATLGPETILAAWLYRTTRHTAADALKARRRRQAREQEAFMQSHLNQPGDETWRRLAPLLDDALAALAETDRTALLLRYFENKTAREIAAALRVEEAAAQKRVARALDKLRNIFAKRGVALTAAAIASALAANSAPAVPAALAMAVTAASLTVTQTATLGIVNIMTISKLKLGFNVLALAGLTTALVVQHQTQTKLRTANEALRQQTAQLVDDNQTLSNRLAALVVSPKLPDQELNELLKLRGEVGLLRGQAGELGRLRQENQRLRAARQIEATPSAAMETPEQQQTLIAQAKMSNARQGVLAFLMFAGDNQKQYPTNLAQAAPYLNDAAEEIGTNFDLVYQGSTADIANPSATIVLREKQAWQALGGKWMKAYGFADGHAEIHAEPTADFSDWESQHLVLPQSNQ